MAYDRSEQAALSSDDLEGKWSEEQEMSTRSSLLLFEKPEISLMACSCRQLRLVCAHQVFIGL